MNKISSITAILLLTSIWGCAPTFVTQVDGYPFPKEFDVSWSGDKSLSARWFFVRWHPQKIESQGFSEFIEQPDYLKVDTLNTLAADTQAVVVNLQVMNPKRKKYRLVRSVTVGAETKQEAVGQWTIREHLNLVVPGPLTPGKEVKLAVNLLSGEPDGGDEPVLSTGELHYRVSAPQSAAAGKEQERRWCKELSKR